MLRLLRFVREVGTGTAAARIVQELLIRGLTATRAWPLLAWAVRRRRSPDRSWKLDSAQPVVPDGLVQSPPYSWDEYREGHFHVFGHQFVGWDGWDWRSDWTSGFSWARDPARSWNFYRPETKGDVKLPWEIGRFEWLRAAHAKTVDADAWPDFLKWASELLEAWLRENPFGETIAWVPMEAGMRLVNLGLLRDAVIRREGSAPRQSQRLLWILDHLITLNNAFLRVTREQFTAPRGNHFAAELAGLAVAQASGALGRPGRTRVRWLKRHMEREVSHQVGGQGEDSEGSLAYHRLVVESFLLTWAALRRCDQSFSPKRDVRERLEAATSLLGKARTPDGDLPRFGDSDDAGFFVGASGNRDPQTLQQFLAFLVGRDRPVRVGQVEVLGPRVGVVGDDVWWVSVWGGTDTAGRRASHSHDDMGSVEAFFDGIPLLVDFGTPPYTGPCADRDGARFRSNHNCLSCMALAHAVPRGPWRSTGGGELRDLASDSRRLQLSCRYTVPFVNFGRIAHIDRRIAVTRGGVTIADITEPALKDCTWTWLIPPPWELREVEPSRWRAGLPDGRAVLLDFQGATTLQPRAGRYYPRYSSPVGCHAIRVTRGDSSMRAPIISLRAIEKE